MWEAAPFASSDPWQEVLCKVRQGNAGGSGTFVGQNANLDAVIVSAAHIFRSTGAASIKLGTDGKSFPATVHEIDRHNDVAILSAHLDRKITSCTVADSDPALGMKIWKIGYPSVAGGALDIRAGRAIPPRGHLRFNSTCLSNRGDSGGALVDEEGCLVSEIYGSEGLPYTTCGSGTEPICRLLEKHGWAERCIFHRPRRPRGPGPGPGDDGGGGTPPPMPKPDPVVVAPVPVPVPVPVPAPVPAPIPIPPTMPVVIGQAGPPGKDGQPGKQGPQGPAGPAGKDGASVDVSGLTNQITSLQTQITALQGQIKTLTGNVTVQFVPPQ